MKMTLLSGLVVAAILAVSVADALAKKKKHKPKPDLSKVAVPEPGTHADYSDPAGTLAPYIANLEQLLTLQRSAPAPVMAFLGKASGQIPIMRLEFTAQRKTADAEHQADFDAAITTCDLLTRSLDERQKALGDINASRAVKGSGKLENGPRKDVLSQGIKGGDLAKAVGTVAELKREQAATAAANKGAGQTDDAMTANSLNRWNKRTVELRKFITDAYAQTK